VTSNFYPSRIKCVSFALTFNMSNFWKLLTFDDLVGCPTQSSLTIVFLPFYLQTFLKSNSERLYTALLADQADIRLEKWSTC